MTEVKRIESNQIAPTSIRASWKIKVIDNVSAVGDRNSTENAFVALDRSGLNSDLAMHGLAKNLGFRILERDRENWLPERDPSQPISTIENHGDTVVHTREIIDIVKGSEKIRRFIVNIVTAREASSIGLEELTQESETDTQQVKIA